METQTTTFKEFKLKNRVNGSVFKNNKIIEKR